MFFDCNSIPLQLSQESTKLNQYRNQMVIHDMKTTDMCLPNDIVPPHAQYGNIYHCTEATTVAHALLGRDWASFVNYSPSTWNSPPNSPIRNHSNMKSNASNKHNICHRNGTPVSNGSAYPYILQPMTHGQYSPCSCSVIVKHMNDESMARYDCEGAPGTERYDLVDSFTASEFYSLTHGRNVMCDTKNYSVNLPNTVPSGNVNSYKGVNPNTTSNSNKYRQLPCKTFITVGTCPYRDRCVYLHDPRILCKDAKTKTRKKNKEDILSNSKDMMDSTNNTGSNTDALFWPPMFKQDLVKIVVQDRSTKPMKSHHRVPSHDNGNPTVIQQYHVPIPHCVHKHMNIINTHNVIHKKDSNTAFENSGYHPRDNIYVPLNVANSYTGQNYNGTGFGSFHDQCLYSMWMHFTEFCMINNQNMHTAGCREHSISACDASNNPVDCVAMSPNVNMNNWDTNPIYNKYIGTRRLSFFINLNKKGLAISSKSIQSNPMDVSSMPVDVTVPSLSVSTINKENQLNLGHPLSNKHVDFNASKLHRNIPQLKWLTSIDSKLSNVSDDCQFSSKPLSVEVDSSTDVELSRIGDEEPDSKDSFTKEHTPYDPIHASPQNHRMDIISPCSVYDVEHTVEMKTICNIDNMNCASNMEYASNASINTNKHVDILAY